MCEGLDALPEECDLHPDSGVWSHRGAYLGEIYIMM